MNDKENIKASNGFSTIKQELIRRTQKPLQQFTFWVYMITAVGLLGGAGVWYELVMLANQEGQDYSALKVALLTFSPAVIGASSLSMVFENQKSRELLAFSVLCLVGMFFIFLLLSNINGFYGLVLSVIFALLSVWVWWIANSDNQGLYDDINPIDSVGGSLSEPPQGSTEGWDV